MGLREPPKEEHRPRILGRILVVAILALATGVAVWTAVTNQRIDLVEDTQPDDLELVDPASVNGVTINVVTESGGPVPVILLHDVDVSGGVLWDAVASGIGGRFSAVRVDLPGFGLSDRFPTEGPEHTVASMAPVVAAIIDERYGFPAVLVGVGLGGEVAAELAVTRPDLVRGLVLVDVDFWETDGWIEIAEKLPLVGRAATFTFQTGGGLAQDQWAPNCETGGWCPTESQQQAREVAVSVQGSTDSIRSLLRTLPASLVPSDLSQVSAPAVFIWSTKGDVPVESVDRVKEELPEITVVEVDLWRAHLEAPATIIDAIESVGR